MRDAADVFVHEAWTVEDGLPVNSINALLQSRDGYIWIGTFDGLVRFDGVRFTLFSSANSPGLPNNRVTSLLETRDGTLWLTTEDYRLVSFRDGVFTDHGADRGLRERTWVHYEDRGGGLWIGTDHGLGVIEGDRFIPVDPETIRGRVTAIVQTRDGAIWAGLAPGGLFRIQNGDATSVSLPDALIGEAVNALYEDPAGTLWIGTNRAVWRYRSVAERMLRTDRVLAFRASPRTRDLWVLTESRAFRLDREQLVHVADRTPFAYRPAFRPDPLVPDRAGRMLFTSGGADLYRDGVLIHSLPERLLRSRDDMRITGIVVDHEGSLWLGTHAAGLHRLKPAPFSVYSVAEGLSHHNVYSVYEDRAGTIWIGTLGGGTNRLDGTRITRLADADGFPPTVLSFLQDRAGRLWLGGGNGPGVRVCPPPVRRCARPAASPLGERAALAIQEAADGALWFGTGDGLFRLEGANWVRFGESDGAPSSPVRAFQQTRDGALWMGTNGGGLARYHDGRFTRVTTADGLPFDVIRSLHQDGDGRLWIGTEGRGLARLDPLDWQAGGSGGRIVSYGMQDGLFDEVIHQMLEDDFGRLWMSSNRGIFWVPVADLEAFAAGHLRSVRSTAYTERDGLRNREANGGSQPAGTKAIDGRLWFATQDGVAVVDPSQIQRNAVPPSVVIEQVRASGEVLHTGSQPLELGVEQRDLEIDYTALSFIAPANVRFRYRLDPYDGDWVDAGSRRTAYYTRVPPGRYALRVIASNNDGVWNETGATLQLHLAPHFYETGVFRLGTVAAVGLLITGGFTLRVRSLRTRTRELGRLVEERTAELREREAQLERQNAQLEQQAGQLQELDRAKSRFFANVSHEFRTPLTLMLGPLRDLTDGRHGRLPDALRRRLDMMSRNGQRLLRLVNQVLDVAKIESGSLALATEPRDLVELTRAIAMSFTPLAERRDIKLHFRSCAGPLIAQVDAEQIEKVVANLLSNAFKFTDPGGEVEVEIGEESGAAVLAVRDTGIGIAAEQLPHVFERFYQADNSARRRHEGTGIGLSLVRELVELHGGTVAADSRAGSGSLFCVRLPLSLETPRPDAPTGERLRPLQRDGTTLNAQGEPDIPLDRATAEAEGAGLDRTAVLVVDDNTDIRAYVRSVLEPAFRVIEAADGLQGLERAREALPDLIVADVMMPRLDGLALARALRTHPATDCIPVILLTARAGEKSEIEGLRTGADDYLTKPFHAGVLEARVGALIASRRRLRERFRQEGLPAPVTAPGPAPRRSELEVRLRAIIEANLTDSDFDLEALAVAAGLNYQQLYRRISAELQTTPSHFIRGMRVERAAQLLRDGAGSITEVAYSVGFNSLSYFHRCFRERYGIAPSELSKTHA